MRYLLTSLLALGIGITAAVPAAFAANNADPACYQNGVASSCTQPAPVTLYPVSSPGTISGAPAPVSVWTVMREDNMGR